MFLPNAPTTTSKNPNFWALFWVLVFLHQLYFGWFLVRSDFVPYVMDGNETFSVWWHAHNLYTFDFWKSFGLTDESYGLTEASHPFFHTHQGNMPRLFGFLIYALGARTVEAQVLITTLVIGNLTLFFCYASIAKITRPAIAFIFCLFLFSDYLLYAQWHVVTYRVWYGFLFFGTLFAISNAKDRIWPYALLGLLFFLLFYFELVFAGYVSVAAGLWVLWLHSESLKRIATLFAVQITAGLAALTLLFTQLVLVFGIEIIKADFLTTFVARNASTPDTNYGSVEVFFRNHNIVFWNNFREGASLRTLIGFMRSLGFYLFQVWTPVFFILIAIPLFGIVISFLQGGPLVRSVVGKLAATRDLQPKSTSLMEARLVYRSLLMTRESVWPLLGAAVVTVLVLMAVMLPGALFGVVPPRGPEIIGTFALLVAIAGSLLPLVLAGWIGRLEWIPVYRGILTASLGAVLILKSHILYDQIYSEIWLPLYKDWTIRLLLRAATIVTFVVSVGIAVIGASASFGSAKRSAIRRALVFLGIGFVAYVLIYLMSPGYVLSGYAERHAPFAIFFVAMAPAVAIYALISAGRRYGQLLFADAGKWLGGRWIVALLFLITVFAPVLLWVRVQVYYASLFPPDHLAFLQKLRSPLLRGATFAVNNYAAPVAYYAGNWAYFDTAIGDDVDLRDPSSRWFADWKVNPQYAHPDYYLCMKGKTFSSALLERYPTRLELPFRFCADEKILKQDNLLSSKIIAGDAAQPKFWSIVALDAGRPKIDAISTAVAFDGRRWTITTALKIGSDGAHPTNRQELELLALPGVASCEIKGSRMETFAMAHDRADLVLPIGFSGAFLVRARVGSGLENSEWKVSDLWVVIPTPYSPASGMSRCPATPYREP